MHAPVMKWVSIAALMLTVVFWNAAVDYQVELDAIVTVAAAVALIEAIRARKYHWAAIFFVVGLVFNPVVPVFLLSGGVGLSFVILSMAPFAISLVALRHPLMSMPSITDRNPGSQSL